MKKKWEFHNYYLSKRWLYSILVYYIVILKTGIVVSIIVLSNISGFVSKNILLYTTFASMAVSAMLCSVQYLKRIYKACLEERIHFSHSDKELCQIGNIIYFILRPIYSMVFVIVAEFALLSCVIIIAPIDFQINERFLYFCVVMAGVIGFSIGRILDKFEIMSLRRIDNIFENKEEN